MKIHYEKLVAIKIYIILNTFLIPFVSSWNFFFNNRVLVYRANNSILANTHFERLCAVDWINIDSVILSRTNIHVIEPQAFKCLWKELKHLDISRNHIRVLPHDIFRGLRRMKHLDFSSNLIEAIPERIFDDLVELETIYGHSNMIRSLSGTLFFNSKNIQEVRFDNNELVELDKRLFANLTLLLHLNINHNKLRSLDGILPLHRKIHAVDIAYKDIGKLKTFWQNRLEVYAEGNAIKSAGFHIPEHVVFLGLKDNKLQTFPISIEEHAARTSDFRITLSQNSWPCDCSVLPLKKFLSNHGDKVTDIDELSCSFRDNSTAVLAKENSLNLCYSVALIAGGAVALTVIMIALIICYIKNYSLRCSSSACCKKNKETDSAVLVEEKKSKFAKEKQLERI